MKANTEEETKEILNDIKSIVRTIKWLLYGAVTGIIIVAMFKLFSGG